MYSGNWNEMCCGGGGVFEINLQDLDAYYKGCLFLPKLNNEIASNWNATYKDRLSSLNHLVLIMVCSLFSLILLEIPFQPIQILFMTCFKESMYERYRVQNIFCSFFMHNQPILLRFKTKVPLWPIAVFLSLSFFLSFLLCLLVFPLMCTCMSQWPIVNICHTMLTQLFLFFVSFWGFYNCSIMFMSLGLFPWTLTYKLKWELHHDFAVWAWHRPNSPRNSLVWILWGRTEQCSPNSPRGGHASFNTTFLFCSRKPPHLFLKENFIGWFRVSYFAFVMSSCIQNHSPEFHFNSFKLKKSRGWF